MFTLEQIRQKQRAENSLGRALFKIAFDQVCKVNPSPTIILQILFKSMIIKGLLHCLATLLQFNLKMEPITQVNEYLCNVLNLFLPQVIMCIQNIYYPIFSFLHQLRIFQSHL